ncbi:SRPBCC domain-containing protein [Streptomyces sp. TRM S81-3]|uniref:SRPBCC domain-containing protein n=1 Tax=Streptomyces griseicoloratus TaxID=2752516 RepID=A0A926L047_9ACTN|nr:SRPBCC domain-containing protein [Streptomyces griseicoloratus]MBD0418919.1 SRPBCC domain-containing protein [Streptomyces griseicoloratus]
MAATEATGPEPATGRHAGSAVPPVRHDTFTVGVHLDAPPDAVFEAFADTSVRRRWFRLPGRQVSYRHDFTVAGGETASSVFTIPGAPPERLVYDSRYLGITPGSRIVYAYTSTVDDIPRWSSLVTVELVPERPGGTHLRWTEQAAFLTPSAEPEHDLPHLRGAARLRLNGLPAALTAAADRAGARPREGA